MTLEDPLTGRFKPSFTILSLFCGVPLPNLKVCNIFIFIALGLGSESALDMDPSFAWKRPRIR